MHQCDAVLAEQASAFFLLLLHLLVLCSMLSVCSSALLIDAVPCCIQTFAEKDCIIPVGVWNNFKIKS